MNNFASVALTTPLAIQLKGLPGVSLVSLPYSGVGLCWLLWEVNVKVSRRFRHRQMDSWIVWHF